MLIECLIEREGFTSVSVQRSTYEFRRNRNKDQVCNVLSDSHAAYLLSLPDFRLYEKEEPPADSGRKYTCNKCGLGFDYPGAHHNHQKACK